MLFVTLQNSVLGVFLNKAILKVFLKWTLQCLMGHYIKWQYYGQQKTLA